MPDADHVIEYHVITSGSAWASVIGHDVEPVWMSAGDVVAFPQGDAHVLSSARGMRGTQDMSVFERPEIAARIPLLLNLDGGGEDKAHFVCGFLGCDSRPFNPLLESCLASCMSTIPTRIETAGSTSSRALRSWRQKKSARAEAAYSPSSES